MRIGFDGKRAVQNFTGLGNYSRYVIETLCRFYPQHQYTLYAPKKKTNRKLEMLLEQYPYLKTAYPNQSRWRRFSSIWRIWGISKQLPQEGIEVFHGLSNELPLNIRRAKGIRSVVTIHDLIFLLFPQYYRPIDRAIYAYKFRKACQNADKVIAISECTKRDIIRLFQTPEEKIEVIYQGCDASFMEPATADAKEEAKATYRLPERFILNVGSIEERKNILLIVKAMSQLPQEVHLVIVGKRTAYTDKVEKYATENGLIERVHFLSNVPFQLLPAIYQLSELFVYPSRYEGFGIPIIEALHSGVPVVAATGSCLEEAGGPDAVYVDPDNIEEAAQALNRLLTHPEERESRVLRGKEYVKRFSEEKQVQALFELYERLIASKEGL